MWAFGIALAAFVYLVVIASLFFSIRLTRKIIGKKNIEFAEKQTIFIVLLVLIIYLVPIIGMCIAFFYNVLIGMIIGFSMLISTFPLTYLVIIPLSDMRKLRYYEEKFGKDSYAVELLKNRLRRGKNN